MIKTQDLKLQIDELTKQNDMVLTELDQVKKMLMNVDSSQNTQSGGMGQQASNLAKQASNATRQNKGQSQNSNQADSSGQQVSDLAYELLKIKDLVEKLEQKTSQYVSSQTNGALTEKDAVNLVLTLMNGMVDWASEFVTSKASSNAQVQ